MLPCTANKAELSMSQINPVELERTPTDGKPYYCEVCGMGFGEYMACEMPDCKLESEEQAQRRAKNWNQLEQRILK